jgi:dihydroxyacid dehydratase/phosphogluconate dehydratase
MAAEAGMSRSHGTCNTMGTASTMASLVEALGLCLSGNATIAGRGFARKARAGAR